MSDRIGRFLADLVLIIHFLWGAMVIVSLPAVFLEPHLRPFIAVCVSVMLLAWLFTNDCPLRSIEHRLRSRFHAEGAHGEPFMYHYLGRWIGMSPAMTKRANVLYTVAIIVALLVV